MELSVALALAGLALLMALPALSDVVRRTRLESATRRLAGSMVAARWGALASGRATGLQLRAGPEGGLLWTLCRDGNGNGLRSADVATGIDPAIRPATRLSDLAPGVRAGILAHGSIPRLPPQRGALRGLDDPVKFGSSDLASFSPLGSASPGSIYLTDGTDMTALVVNGQTGRLRLFRFNREAAHWKELN
jgi:hypothetical protein